MTRHPWLALAAALAALPAQAETSPYYIGASQALSRSSNLLRLPDGVTAPDGFSKSDTVSATSLLAGLDQPFGRQRAYGSLTLRSSRLASNEIYNNDGYVLTAGLDWATIERVSGSLKVFGNRNLASFNADGIGLVAKKNIETSKQMDAALRVGVVTELTAELYVSNRRVEYSAEEYRSLEFRQDSASLGLRWRPSGASLLGVALRETNGRYPKFITLFDGSFRADSFDRRDIDFTATFDATGASTLSTRISIGKAEYEVAKERGFSGVTGALSWNWRPTGKLRLDAELLRDTSQSSASSGSAISVSSSDYNRLTTSLRMRIEHALSAKVAANAALTHGRRDLASTLQQAGATVDRSGQDRTTNLSVGAIWAPVRALQFGCDLARERRSSDTTLSTSYGDTTTSCNGQFLFQ